MPRRPPFTEAQARDAIGRARSWGEALRHLGYRNMGGNAQTLKRHARRWGISTEHFDPRAVMLEALDRGRRWRRGKAVPLERILVRNSTFSRGHLKDRLFQEGLKQRACELCGQGERWRGRRMSLILDHINGTANDNRLENLRIVCPNCAATFDTHCGRNLPQERTCAGCGATFVPRTLRQRYCSLPCFHGERAQRTGTADRAFTLGMAQPLRRKVERPEHQQLLDEIDEFGYVGVGRKYGVSDNAVRKWVRFYERQAERERREAEGRRTGTDVRPSEAEAA